MCSDIVVQHTSISTEFANNTWRYEALYERDTDIIRGEHEDNIRTEAV